MESDDQLIDVIIVEPSPAGMTQTTLSVAKSALEHSEVLKGAIEGFTEESTGNPVTIGPLDASITIKTYIDVIAFLVAIERAARGLDPSFTYDTKTNVFPAVFESDTLVPEEQHDQVWNDYVNRYMVDHDREPQHAQIAKIAVVADYLNIQRLLDLTMDYLANLMRAKSVEELRLEFGFTDDMTPEELEEVETATSWAVAQPRPE